MSFERNPCVYILASGRNGTLYTGVTSNLMQRLYQHREGVTGGFTSQYAVHRLVHFEMFGDMVRAITREKQIKNWRREWKVNLIQAENPRWRDMAEDFGFETLPPRKPKDGP